MIKTMLLIFVFTLLIGCQLLSNKFDNNEFAAFVKIESTANIMSQQCNIPHKIKQSIETLLQDTEYVLTYTKHRKNNEHVYAATKILNADVHNLNDAYENGDPSVNYCKSKLQLIKIETHKILEILKYKE